MPISLTSTEMVARSASTSSSIPSPFGSTGPAWERVFAIDWVFTDLGRTYRTELSNGVLIQDVDPAAEADLTLTLTKPQLLGLLGGAGLGGIATDGDTSLLQRLLSFLDELTPSFAIVTP